MFIYLELIVIMNDHYMNADVVSWNPNKKATEVSSPSYSAWGIRSRCVTIVPSSINPSGVEQ